MANIDTGQSQGPDLPSIDMHATFIPESTKGLWDRIKLATLVEIEINEPGKPVFLLYRDRFSLKEARKGADAIEVSHIDESSRSCQFCLQVHKGRVLMDSVRHCTIRLYY